MKHYFETADCSNYELLRENARNNRNNPTEAERIMWFHLSGGIEGNKLRRQHIIGDYIVDFVCLKKHLVIEIDGEYHNSLEQKVYDEERTYFLNSRGYKVIRFTNDDVMNNIDSVMQEIKAELY